MTSDGTEHLSAELAGVAGTLPDDVDRAVLMESLLVVGMTGVDIACAACPDPVVPVLAGVVDAEGASLAIDAALSGLSKFTVDVVSDTLVVLAAPALGRDTALRFLTGSTLTLLAIGSDCTGVTNSTYFVGWPVSDSANKLFTFLVAVFSVNFLNAGKMISSYQFGSPSSLLHSQ